ncbi:phosphoglycolate phosphatase [Dongia soli]|uniref:Phosphoglycolate phosphatase n=1 Tax=Dongia soli TaxID=600628 RepID=A0ABU5ECB1_9PROT|nr:phosphoglycolate phosphatase [Dongia soli]MDY0883838.1 phosphoglycolate phosphatase [Dongia soli]
MPQKRHTLVFDLDGTLVDSAPDIAAAVNQMLAELGAAPVELSRIKQMIGDGTPKLMERVLAAASLTITVADIMPRFMVFYDRYATRQVTLYPGVAETLRRLKAASCRLGVCTNKPTKATHAVLAAGGIDEVFEAVIGGDALPQRKPQPEPLWATIKQLGGTTETSVMIGDSAVDFACAQAAGIPALILPSGYGMAEVAATPGFTRFADLPDVLRQLDT